MSDGEINQSIFEAWPDEDWFDAGTAVRVSLVCFGHTLTPTPLPQGEGLKAQLAGEAVAVIHADLTAGDGETVMDLTKAQSIKTNLATCFMGASKKAPFDIEGELARSWLAKPNPNNLPNHGVVRPVCNALDLTRRNGDRWIIDFGATMAEVDASLYELPFEYVIEHVKPIALKNSDKQVAKHWWRHARPRVDMRNALSNLSRYIATPAVAKHRTFVWLDQSVLPDQALLAIAREDDTSFGILHSRFHELWSLGLCTSLEDRPRYTPTTCFETFPFPAGLTPIDTMPKSLENLKTVGRVSSIERNPTSATNTSGYATSNPTYVFPIHGHTPTPAQVSDATAQHHADAIATAAFKLNQLRENWLNPPDWVDWVITPEEAKAGFPKRPQAKPGHEADLKKRTLTNLYNAKPAWLVNAHQALDKTVALAYGWNDYTADMPDAEILQRLLQLNLTRADQT